MLSPEEEARVEEILRGLISKVRKRRVMVYPYFKDFDRVRTGFFFFVSCLGA